MTEAMGIAIGRTGPDTKVISGHGVGFTDREGMLEVLTVLITLRDRVQKLIDSGRSFDEVLAAKLAQ
jgi:cyclase